MGNRKKVVHVITGLGDGGAEGVMSRLCLKSDNYEHVVVSLTDKGKYGAILEAEGITVQCIHLNTSLFRITKLLRVLNKERPEIIQTWMYHADLIGGVLARCLRIRKVFWGIRHSSLESDSTKQSTLIVAKISAILSKFIPTKIICCAESAKVAHIRLGYCSSKMIVIPNGYDLSKFYPNETVKIKIRDELLISKDIFLVGMVARYNPAKDHANLLKALKLLKSKLIDFKCLLIGTGIDKDNKQLVKYIEDNDLLDTVELLGPRDNIPDYMNALDVHVLSSSSEGFPNVLAEAMACGTPCITTDVGDAREVVGYDDGVCDARRPEPLAEIIHHFYYEWLNNPLKWRERQSFVLNRVQTNFEISKMVSSFENQWDDF